MKTQQLPNHKTPGRVLLAIIAAYIIMVLLLSGCVTERQRARICASCPKTDSISVKQKEIIKRYDSLIYLTSEPETLVVFNPCDSLKLKKFDIKQTKNGIKQEIISDGNSIVVKCNDDSLKKVIEGLNVYRTVSKEAFAERIEQQACNKQHVTNWDNFCIYCGYLFFVIVIICIIIVIVKLYTYRFKVIK
jgi:Zn-dependent M16 (insulinase) family peptidase